MSGIYFLNIHEMNVELEAHSNDYFNFEDDITSAGVIGWLAVKGYDNLFALEVVNRMKELKRI